jgi:hypothetical protein
VESSEAPLVAVVAKAPRAGDVKTRLCPPLTPGDAADLHAAFLADTADLVTGLAGVRGAFVFTPAEDEPYFARLAPAFVRVLQQGPDLGARLQHAFAALFATGARVVVAVGADTPTLPAALITDAVSRLADDRADVVLGPTDDGGYYLVGLRRPAPALFDGIAWSTPAVLGETLQRAETAGLRVALLPPWFDVDTPVDLERLEATLADPDIRARWTRARLRAREEARA